MTSTSPLSVFLLLSCFFPEGVRSLSQKIWSCPYTLASSWGPSLAPRSSVWVSASRSKVLHLLSRDQGRGLSHSEIGTALEGILSRETYVHRATGLFSASPELDRCQYFAWDWLLLAKVLIPLLFKCKISKLVDEVYCGGTQVRVLPHTHTSYFIIQIMLLAPCRSRIISASLAAVCPVSNFLVLYYPLPGFLHLDLSFPFWWL